MDETKKLLVNQDETGYDEDVDEHTNTARATFSKYAKSFQGRTKEQWKRMSMMDRIMYYIPIFQWLPHYNLTSFRKDLIAGVTVGIMLAPQSLAYGNLIGIPPIYGLQTAFFPLIIYFLLGSSHQLAIGPEAMIAILTSGSLDVLVPREGGSFIDGPTNNSPDDTPLSPEEYAQKRADGAFHLAFFVGCFTLILGLARFGFLAYVLSRPLLCGFINAVAFEIIFEQLDKFFGIRSKLHSFHKIPDIIHNLHEVNMPTVYMGLACLSFLVFMRFFKRKIAKKFPWFSYFPEIMVVVISSILVTWQLRLDKKGMHILGAIHTGFLTPKPPTVSLSLIQSIAPSALTIAMIGIVESILIGNTYASKHNYRVSTNRELVAFGVANIISSVLQTFPAFGSMPRSAVNNNAGATTPMATLFTAIITGLTIVVLLPAFTYLPSVTMGAIVVNAALGLYEFHDIFFLWRIRAFLELSLLVSIFVITLLFGVGSGITFTFTISLFLMVKQTSAPHVAILKREQSTNKFEEVTVIRDINLFEEKHDYMTLSQFSAEKGVLTVRIEEPLYFANISQAKELFSKLEQRGNVALHGIIIDASNIPSVDATAIGILMDMLEEWNKRDITVCFARIRPSIKQVMELSGLVEMIGSDKFFDKRDDAMNYLLRNQTV